MSRADLASLLGIAAVYVVSRTALHGIGVAFDSFPLQEHWQVLPVELLQREPWTSIWHLHSQPPLFNVLLALAFHFADWPHDILAAFFAMTAVSTLMLLYVLQRRWHVPVGAAFIVTVAVAMNPSFIGYEHWPFYTAIEPLLLLAGAVAVTFWDRASGRQAAWAACAFGLSASALVLLRALFHPAWAAAVAVCILGVHIRAGRRVSRAQIAWALLPCAVGVALMTKNVTISGHFAASSWVGMNMSNMALHAVSRSEAAALEARGLISPLHRLGPFQRRDAYQPFASIIEPALSRPMPTGVAALDLEQKLSGQPNFNNLWYAAISRVMLRDVQQIIVAAPAGVAGVFGQAVRLFCRPTSDYGGISANVQRMWPLEMWYRRLLYPGESIAIVATALLVVVGWCSRRAFARALPVGGGGPYAGAAAYVAVAVSWVAIVGNIAEFGENNRFRFALDPLLVAVISAGIAAVVRARRAGRTDKSRLQPASQTA